MAKVISFPATKRIPPKPSVAVSAFDGAAVERRIGLVPIIAQALFFLEQAGLEKGIKLTATGSLGRNFVQSFWDKHIAGPDDIRFRPTRELDCSEVTRIHSLLAHSKYVRKFKGAICITPKGRRVLESGPSVDLYRDLLNTGIFAWNWAYEDRYPDFDFIQGSARELIAQLWQWPSKSVSAAEFFDAVFECFDEEGNTVEPSHATEDESSTLDAHEWVVRCFHVRFFQRFCVPFGILRALSESRFLGDPSDAFEKTEFFISDFPKIVRNR